MSIGSDARLSALDTVLDAEVRRGAGLVNRLRGNVAPDEDLSADLFQLVDVLDSSVALRRALADPGTPETAKQGLAHSLFDGKLSKAAVNVLVEAVALRWPGPRTLVDALERQAVRAELLRADAASQLEETEDELFRFARLVKSNSALRDAIADRSVDVAHRQELVGSLLAGKATDSTVTLARRGVAARDRNFDDTLEGYVQLAAHEKNRVIATVHVATALTADQISRMEAALSRQAGRPVFVQVIVDPRVLGGARVELGDEVIEGTVAGKLENARRLFS